MTTTVLPLLAPQLRLRPLRPKEGWRRGDIEEGATLLAPKENWHLGLAWLRELGFGSMQQMESNEQSRKQHTDITEIKIKKHIMTTTTATTTTTTSSSSKSFKLETGSHSCSMAPTLPVPAR